MTALSLNIASFTPLTQSLGPGKRAALWVQGCPIHCPGCIVPEWQENRMNTLFPVPEISQMILSAPAISGLTLSGGEPTLQAEALAALLNDVKKQRDLNVICYSGFTLEVLIKRIADVPAIGQLLEQLDVLIDGPYVRKLDDNRGLRGSSNQRIHYLTERLKYFDFESAPRQAEFQFVNGDLLLAGVPPLGVLPAFEELARNVKKSPFLFQEVKK
jgi:anaerobic ribonucleoside-triphosphate reductase activating protein